MLVISVRSGRVVVSSSEGSFGGAGRVMADGDPSNEQRFSAAPFTVKRQTVSRKGFTPAPVKPLYQIILVSLLPSATCTNAHFADYFTAFAILNSILAKGLFRRPDSLVLPVSTAVGRL
jgi:hypothetical protein